MSSMTFTLFILLSLTGAVGTNSQCDDSSSESCAGNSISAKDFVLMQKHALVKKTHSFNTGKSDPEDLWQVYGQSKRCCRTDVSKRCKNLTCKKKVQSQYECQQLTIAEGKNYYEYEANRGCCNAISSCDRMKDSKRDRPWAVYHQADSTPTPSPEPPTDVEPIPTPEAPVDDMWNPAKCTSPGTSRRRCPRTNARCYKRDSHRCRFFSAGGNFNLGLVQAKKDSEEQFEQAKGSCAALSKKCGEKKFCGVSGQGVQEFAGSSIGKNAFEVCMTCQGGYGSVGATPAWYKYRDFANSHKCIDEEMATEMTTCRAQKQQRESDKKQEFKDRMDNCAQKHGAANFDELAAECSNADVFEKMEECKQTVTSEMMAIRPHFDLSSPQGL